MNHSLELIRLKTELAAAEAVVVGAGAGLSASAGFAYDGERFLRYFADFAGEFGIRDMYSGGFYPFPDEETRWAWWSRHIWCNRYTGAPRPVYDMLYALLDGRGEDRTRAPKKNYFVLTTNVDHLFQKAGFDKTRLFYTQGDYGLWQCSLPCHKRTYDNAEQVREMLLAQGFSENEAEKGAARKGRSAGEADGGAALQDLPGLGVVPPQAEEGGTDFARLSMMIPPYLVPRCPVCGRPMAMNLRADETFVEDRGWANAAGLYRRFLERHVQSGERVLFLELGVGGNTPGIIKYPFWKMTYENDRAVYACLNRGQAGAPDEIRKRSVCIDGDIGEILAELLELQGGKSVPESGAEGAGRC